MFLTKSYKRVRSVFDSPVNYVKDFYTHSPLLPESQKAIFRVGLVEYSVEISQSGHASLAVSKIHTEPKEEFLKLMQRVFNDPNLDYPTAVKKSKVVNVYSINKLGNAFQVFAGVIKAMKTFREKYNPTYFYFEAHDLSRISFYEKMFKLGFPDARIQVDRVDPHYANFFIRFFTRDSFGNIVPVKQSS